VEGAPAAGRPGGRQVTGNDAQHDPVRTEIRSISSDVEERRVRRHRDRPLQAPVMPGGYRSPTDWTVVYGHAYAIPASPTPDGRSARKTGPSEPVDGVVPLGPGAAVWRRGPCRRHRWTEAVRKVDEGTSAGPDRQPASRGRLRGFRRA